MMMSSVEHSRKKDDEYIRKEIIGKGSFGEVEKCEHKESNKIYAVKTIQVPKLYLDNIEEEANNMIKSNSEYVLELVDHFYDDYLGSYILVTPYYKMGSFDTLMKKQWELEELLLFFYIVSKGLHDLSKNHILHLDLKPENILIKGHGQYVLCDLGCSRKLEDNMAASRSINVLKVSARGGVGQGTTDYASPDLMMNDEMTPFTDIWSLGVILYKVIFKKHPLYGISVSNLMKNAQNFMQGKYKISYPITEETAKFVPIIKIVERMLVCSSDRQRRMPWDKIIEAILSILKIPEQQAPYIVTNFDNLLSYVDKICILLSAFLYYLEQVKPKLTSTTFDLKTLIKNICIYLLTASKEVMLQTKNDKNVPTNDLQFYLFESTKKYLTKKQKSYAETLERQAHDLANCNNVMIEYGNLQVFRDRVVADMGRLYKILRGYPKPENIIQSVQLNKLTLLVDFIGFRNQLRYQYFKQLVEFVKKDLINS